MGADSETVHDYAETHWKRKMPSAYENALGAGRMLNQAGDAQYSGTKRSEIKPRERPRQLKIPTRTKRMRSDATKSKARASSAHTEPTERGTSYFPNAQKQQCICPR